MYEVFTTIAGKPIEFKNDVIGHIFIKSNKSFRSTTIIIGVWQLCNKTFFINRMIGFYYKHRSTEKNPSHRRPVVQLSAYQNISADAPISTDSFITR